MRRYYKNASCSDHLPATASRIFVLTDKSISLPHFIESYSVAERFCPFKSPFRRPSVGAQIIMKVIHTSKFSCYNRLDYKGIPASVSDAPTRLLIDVQVRLSTQVGISF